MTGGEVTKPACKNGSRERRGHLDNKVSVKIKKKLSPGDFTPSAFLYEESKTPIARLKTLNLRDGTIGF